MITQEQREQRKNGLGATDAAAVLGLHPYMTPYQLWQIKTGRVEEESILSDSRIRLRNLHENTVANEYAYQKGVKLRKVNNTLFHKHISFMFCHLDRIVTGLSKIIECKTAMSYMKKYWGEQGTDIVPPYYIVQIQHQYAVSGYSEADIALLLDIDDFRIFPIERDDEIIKVIEERNIDFWENYVKKDIAPPLTTINDYRLHFKQTEGDYVEATSDILETLVLIKELRTLQKEKSIKEEELTKKLLAFIGNKEGISFEDKNIVTWRANKNGIRSLRIS